MCLAVCSVSRPELLLRYFCVVCHGAQIVSSSVSFSVRVFVGCCIFLWVALPVTLTGGSYFAGFVVWRWMGCARWPNVSRARLMWVTLGGGFGMEFRFSCGGRCARARAHAHTHCDAAPLVGQVAATARGVSPAPPGFGLQTLTVDRAETSSIIAERAFATLRTIESPTRNRQLVATRTRELHFRVMKKKVAALLAEARASLVVYR